MSTYNDDIQKWIKRSNRKAAKLINHEDGKYRIVYLDKGKVRVGVVRDGMYCRYGVSCYGAMYSTDPMSLWQSGPGACTQGDVQIMTDYLNDTSALADFDFGSIKELTW
jgi:hypothetical protein